MSARKAGVGRDSGTFKTIQVWIVFIRFKFEFFSQQKNESKFFFGLEPTRIGQRRDILSLFVVMLNVFVKYKHIWSLLL